MKIVFLCGSLEPACDGVGDYTRRLAGEMIRQGHQVAAVALNDTHLQELLMGRQHSEGVDLPVLRIPADWKPGLRLEYVRIWIEEFDPDWLSLQFVPFSFHPKGLSFGLGSLLKKLGKGRRWHIMFHELWVGMDINSPRKHIWWGQTQRLLIRQLIKKIKPAVVHTQTRLYQLLLLKLGVNALYLPLFSNIPLLNHSSPLPVEEQKRTPNFVLFGGIHPKAPVEEFAKEAALYAKKREEIGILTIIGRCGNEQSRWLSVCESAGLVVDLLGEQSPENISEVLINASIGISTTPTLLAEKSGSVAAMWAHKLPVIGISQPWSPREVNWLDPLAGIVEFRQGNLEACMNREFFIPPIKNVSGICRQLSESLLKTEGYGKSQLFMDEQG